mmetsp:Transcript_18108/g.31743  ORF Transcript_18108/g.31743 Transcript_18108/m.31743 type:complete len:374 (+) Transcript_18108:51-1172(+)|eukprot:CAMPEP_0197624304 /NCGR_PEP_ID=MMETSP1338-20131121/3996_1 /TAXON_ID=43686 ORGANISM="Pelagodinium beii, Strain RCC1491" /NCGR_SAMPLE_ID=MMETSP1338 /ASSEMBLY_ACC=CAM_ASM_000754 /LENGTH=373 /DNA_ID=CAMNT_0043194421 /DNA_START=15 /DNA_END=1136 /DNA_ORIENTATION=+
MLMQSNFDGKSGVLGQFQAFFRDDEASDSLKHRHVMPQSPLQASTAKAPSEPSASSSSQSYKEARKKELEDELKRDLERLAEERKEGLHRIDWQLAEAVETLHAETVQKANQRTQLHKQALAQLENASFDGSVPSRLSSMAESTTARSEQVSPRSHADGSGSVSSASESDEEEPGVWNHVVGFFNRNVPASGNIFAGAGSAGAGMAGFSDLAGSLGLSGLGALTSGADVNGGGSKDSRSAPRPLLMPLSANDQVLLDSLGPGYAKGEPTSPMSRSPATSSQRSIRMGSGVSDTPSTPPPGRALGPKGQGSPYSGGRLPSSMSSDSWRSSRSTKAPPPPPPAPSPFAEDLPAPPPQMPSFNKGKPGGQRQMGWY